MTLLSIERDGPRIFEGHFFVSRPLNLAHCVVHHCGHPGHFFSADVLVAGDFNDAVAQFRRFRERTGIANMLWVRREVVTEAAGKLQSLGVIGYNRGKVTVLDRPKLEEICCECYAVVKREADRLQAFKPLFALN